MSVNKNHLELASEITIAALGGTNWISNPDLVSKFYRAIYKEIATCESTPHQNIR